MADLLALQPNMDIKLHIVAPDARKEKVFNEIRVAVQSPIRQPARRLRRLEEGRVRVDRPDELGSTE